MSEFNQAEFESKAKKMVASYLGIDEKHVSMVWFSKVKSNEAMLCINVDPGPYYYFDVLYLSEMGRYIMTVYTYADCTFYDEKSKDTIVLQAQTEDDKVKDPAETKCPICQEHQDMLGLTDAIDLHLQDDILVLMDTSHNGMRFPKDAFKINYCPFCGRPLNEEVEL